MDSDDLDESKLGRRDRAQLFDVIDGCRHGGLEHPLSPIAPAAELLGDVTVCHHDILINEKAGADPVHARMARHLYPSDTAKRGFDAASQGLKLLPLWGRREEVAALNKKGRPAHKLHDGL